MGIWFMSFNWKSTTPKDNNRVNLINITPDKLLQQLQQVVCISPIIPIPSLFLPVVLVLVLVVVKVAVVVEIMGEAAIFKNRRPS